MKLAEIRQMPRVSDDIKGIELGCKLHESCFRSFHLLQKVKYYLENAVPSKIILELIEEVEDEQN